MVAGILLSKCMLRTMKNWICYFYQIVYITGNNPSLILMSRSTNVACLPLCSSFFSNSQGYMHLKDFENSPTSLLAENKVIYESTSSMVFISSCCFFRNKNLNMLRLKNY